MNDIAHVQVKGEIIQYADDTTVIVTADTMDQLLKNISETMGALREWFGVNGLKLNEDKSNILIFNTVSSNLSSFPVPQINGRALVTSQVVRLLGFELDYTLSWKQHIDITCKKMAKGIYALKQLRNMSSEKSLKEIYFAYVHSTMAYGIILWGGSTDYVKSFKNAKTRHSCVSKGQI